MLDLKHRCSPHGRGSSLAAVEKASPLPWGEGQGEGSDVSSVSTPRGMPLPAFDLGDLRFGPARDNTALAKEDLAVSPSWKANRPPG